MVTAYILGNCVHIIKSGSVDESCSIVFYTWETMQILYQMLADFKSSFWPLGLYEESCVELHNLQDLLERWSVTIREEAPRISK